MARLVAGDDFEAAVLATTGLTLDRFEERVAARRPTAVQPGTWLLASGGWLLVAIGVLVFGTLSPPRPIGSAEPPSTMGG